MNHHEAIQDGLTISYKGQAYKNPRDWRHLDYKFLVPLGRDIFISNLSYKEIGRKWGLSDKAVGDIAARLKKPNMVRVRIGLHTYEWREKRTMKIKLELNLEDKAWTASELICALSRLVNSLDMSKSHFGPILDKKDKHIGAYEIETSEAVDASKEIRRQ